MKNAFAAHQMIVKVYGEHLYLSIKKCTTIYDTRLKNDESDVENEERGRSPELQAL